MKWTLIIFLLILITSVIYPEKWVGQIATYQLIDGSKMATGEYYKSTSLTAACNGFKLGAKVIVTNVKNGKQVEVTITDRIKTESNYFILLTPSAAKLIDLEWETSLAVVEANFTDVNSSEVLNINGLISEGSPDEEKLNKFPKVKWPEEEKTVIKNVEPEIKENPKLDQTKVPKEKQKKTGVDTDMDTKIDTIKENPKVDVTKIPNEKKKIVKLDKDVDSKKEIPQEDVKLPSNEKDFLPDSIMKRYAIDEDVEDSIIPFLYKYLQPPKKQEKVGPDYDTVPTPKIAINKIPNEKNKLISDEYDTLSDPKKEIIKTPKEKSKKISQDQDTNNPKDDIKKYPVNKKAVSDEDVEDSVNPKKEIIKTPKEKDKNIDTDIEDGVNPNKEVVKTPKEKDNIIDSDIEDSINPKKEVIKTPKEKDNIIDTDNDDDLLPLKSVENIPPDKKDNISDDADDETIPALSDDKKPSKKTNLVNEDYDVKTKVKDKIILPTKDFFSKIPKEKSKKIDTDIDTKKTTLKPKIVYSDKFKGEKKVTVKVQPKWVTKLEKGKIYIRFSMTTNKEEGNRRLLLFKEIFKNTVGLSENGKYILLIGPIPESDIDIVIKGLRSFGYKDAYVIKK